MTNAANDTINVALALHQFGWYVAPYECPGNFYSYGFECSASKEAFNALQKSLKQVARLYILSDGNKDVFELQPEFYEKELKIIGSSDGWDYKKHSKWYFDHMKQEGSMLNKLSEWKIRKQELIQCFEDLSQGKVRPLKVLIEY